MKTNIIREKLEEYRKASRLDKTALITNVCAVTGMPRKSVIRAFNRECKATRLKSPPKTGRPRVYSAETVAALAFVWESYEYPCAERLIDQLAEAVRIFKRDKMWSYSEEATSGMLAMSLGAMKVRTVAFAHKRCLMRGIGTTRSGELLKSVPVFFGSWSGKPAGHGQIDTVVHCGSQLLGNMVYTVNYIDVATYWQEPVAQLNKGEVATLTSIKLIRERLPFPLLGMHPDGGSEFINWFAVKWCAEENIELTRSRPSKSNNNCYIEQRNLVVVRKYVGYERYDCAEAVDAMNELYEVLRLYVNFFQPSFKLIGREKRVDANGQSNGKGYKRIYDQVRTPYQRVLDCPNVTEGVKERLRLQYEGLNPKVLRDKIQALTSKLERAQRDLGYRY
jgi:hypothetical protein